MNMKITVLCAALGVGASMSPGISSARAFVDIDVAPPAARVEVAPAPRAGYIWAPGYWNWEGHRHVWVGGRWMHERHGHHWVNDNWEQRNGHWHYDKGHWD
ncbi:MAG TPA: YXWGXW repeat-containing protein [Rudaea sp.]|jgi:hypothetical protein|nr:YXWGXW repeat-containing protein [Rudaea sp.]